MPQLTLTDFVDIVARAGSAKITKIAQVKQRPAYDPKADFYKKVREGIVEMHEKGLPLTHLDDLLTGLKDAKKIVNYPEITAGYGKWLKKAKNAVWFKPPHQVFSAHDVDVVINPEVGLLIRDVPHIIKLYFKGEALTPSKAQIVAHLMEVTFRPKCTKTETCMSVLDTRNSKLVTPSVPVDRLTSGLRGELAYISAVWDEL